MTLIRMVEILQAVGGHSYEIDGHTIDINREDDRIKLHISATDGSDWEKLYCVTRQYVMQVKPETDDSNRARHEVERIISLLDDRGISL